MTGIVIFNVVTIALAVAVGAGVISTVRLGAILDWLHAIIGITPPSQQQARTYALVWIGATIVLVDGLLLMLVVLIRIVK